MLGSKTDAWRSAAQSASRWDDSDAPALRTVIGAG
jgi:hypothetical protein